VIQNVFQIAKIGTTYKLAGEIFGVFNLMDAD